MSESNLDGTPETKPAAPIVIYPGVKSRQPLGRPDPSKVSIPLPTGNAGTLGKLSPAKQPETAARGTGPAVMASGAAIGSRIASAGETSGNGENPLPTVSAIPLEDTKAAIDVIGRKGSGAVADGCGIDAARPVADSTQKQGEIVKTVPVSAYRENDSKKAHNHKPASTQKIVDPAGGATPFSPGKTQVLLMPSDEKIAEIVATLRPGHCSYPDGKIRSRKTGLPCKGQACANGRCRFHGGMTPKGADSPHFKHGKYSKHMPAALLKRYEESERDVELLSARSDVALLDSRLKMLMERLSAGSGAENDWQAVRDEYERIAGAMKKGDADTMSAALRSMGKILQDSAASESLWSEITDLIERKTAVAADEWKRQKDLKQFITIPQMMAVITSLVSTVTKHVEDKRILGLIQADINATIKIPQGAALT